MRGLCVERQLWVHKVAEAQNALESLLLGAGWTVRAPVSFTFALRHMAHALPPPPARALPSLRPERD